MDLEPRPLIEQAAARWFITVGQSGFRKRYDFCSGDNFQQGQFIDGGEIVAAHGTREMPIWGIEFGQPPLSFGAPQPGSPTALEVHERIKLLVDYIKSIQEK